MDPTNVRHVREEVEPAALPGVEKKGRALDGKCLLIGSEIIQGVGDWVNVLQISKFIKANHPKATLNLSLAFVRVDNGKCAALVQKFLDEESKKAPSERLFSQVFIEHQEASLNVMTRGPTRTLAPEIAKLSDEYSNPEYLPAKVDLLVQVATAIFGSHSATKLSGYFGKMVGEEVPLIAMEEMGSRFRKSAARHIQSDLFTLANMGVNRSNHDIGLRLYDYSNVDMTREQFFSMLNSNKEIFPVSPEIGKEGHRFSVAYTQNGRGMNHFIYLAAEFLLQRSNATFFGIDLMVDRGSLEPDQVDKMIQSDPRLKAAVDKKELQIVIITPENLAEKAAIPSSPTSLQIRLFAGFSLDDRSYDLCFPFSNFCSGFSGDDTCCKVMSASAVPFHSYPLWKTPFHFDMINLCLEKKFDTLAKYYLLFSSMDSPQADWYIENPSERSYIESDFGSCYFYTAERAMKKDLADFLVEKYEKISEEHAQFTKLLRENFNFWANLPGKIQEIHW